MSFVKLSRPPEDLSSFLGRKWLEAVRDLFGILNDTQGYNLSATGTTQGTAYLLDSSISVISTATGGVNDSIKLPLISTTKKFPRIVHNGSAATLNIFPNSGDNFYNNPADVGTTMIPGTTYSFWPVGPVTWLIQAG